MKIALINPQTDTTEMREIYGYHENLAIGLIASFLRQNGFDVNIFDLRVQKLNESEIAKLLVKEGFGLVGISVNYATFPSALKIAQLLKLQSNCIIVLGGEHVTYLDEEILKEYSVIDYIVRGEGEETFLELANKIENGEEVSSVYGISFIDKKSGIYIKNPNRQGIKNLDDIPFAARDISLLAQKEDIPIEIGILAQRGCPFTCSFCNAYKYLSNEYPMSVRVRTPLNVVNEMETLLPLFKNKRRILRFYDATFITQSIKNRKWIEEFCTLLEERGFRIPFDAFIRSDSFDFEKDEELIARLKKVGLIGTYVGLEAGDDDTLEVYKKGVKSTQSLRAISNLAQFEIEGATNGVICFYQNATLKEIRNSIVFLHKIGFCTSWNIASRAETLPGIELEKEMSLRKRETLWDVSNYCFADSKVELFYNIVKAIKTKYHTMRFEDYITRNLREAIRLEKFHCGCDQSLHNLENNFKSDLSRIQTITSTFFLKIIDSIERNDMVRLENYNPVIKNYVNEFMGNLYHFCQKYSVLVPLNNVEFDVQERTV